MDVLCRICLETTTKYTRLNTNIENPPSLTFIDFLNKCTSLKACESDKLPQRLCPMCANSMKTFYAFMKLAEQSDIILRETLKNLIAKGGYSSNAEISCEEITIRNEKIEKETEDVNKEDAFHCQPNENSAGSSLYILDIIKEEPCVSEDGTSIGDLKDAEINESERFHSTLDHQEWRLDQLRDFLTYTDRGLASTDAQHSDSEDEVPISLIKRIWVKNEDEASYSQSNFCSREHFGSSNMQITTDKIKVECEEVIKEEASDYQETECTENIDQSIGSNLVLTTLDSKHKCLVCEKVFKYPSNRWKHMRRQHCGGNFFKCETETCGKKFLFEAEYKSHLRVHVDIGETRSDSDITEKCRLPFELAEQQEYACKMCGKKFSAQEDLNLHLENHQGITQKCNQCDKEFKHRGSLNRHIRSHTNPKPFKCENCEKCFGWKNNYIKHREICKRPDEPQELNRAKVECEICGKKVSIEYLMIHMDNHMGITQKCDLCGKEFKHKGSLIRHLSYHNNPKRFNCEICQKSLSNKYRYNKHMEICTSRGKAEQLLNITKIVCEICGKKFSTKEFLDLHMENHKRIRHKCGQCDREFPTVNTLRKHMKWHADPKPFKCENCGRSFGRKYIYTRHMERCTRPRKPLPLDKARVSCEICGKSFTTKGNLNVHMEFHTGITKKCTQCDKEFTTRSALRRHINWHANPMPFKCKNCGKSFTRKYRCVNHMKICKPEVTLIEEIEVKVED